MDLGEIWQRYKVNCAAIYVAICTYPFGPVAGWPCYVPLWDTCGCPALHFTATNALKRKCTLCTCYFEPMNIFSIFDDFSSIYRTH